MNATKRSNVIALYPVHESGAKFRWEAYRHGPAWYMRTHDGCERWIGDNWLSSVPQIRLIASNYGCTLVVS